MIVPSPRLLYLAGLALGPATLAGALPQWTLLALGMLILMVLVVLTDAGLVWGMLDGFSAQAPEVLRLSKGRQGSLEISLTNSGRRVRRVRVGLSWPPEIVSPDQELTVDLPEESPAAGFSWPLSAERRGVYRLERCHLETASPLGFWALRRAVPMDCEIRAYPNLPAEDKSLAALFLNRGGLGVHAQRQIGKGRDFEQLREYLPGDSYEDISWKSTAKRGRPVTKVYQLERTQEIYVVVDASRLSARRPDYRIAAEASDSSILERFISAALILALAAQRQGDLFGLITFSDRVRSFIRAKNGQAHFGTCREALLTLETENVSPDFAELFTFIGARLRRRALLVFLTNMDDPVLAESFAGAIHLISRKHLVLAGMINPPLARPLFESEEVETAEDVYQALGGHLIHVGLKETAKILKQKNVDFSLLQNEKMSAQLVTQYLNVKKRQAL